MIVFNSEENKENLMKKIKSREVIRFNYDSFDSDDFRYIEKIFEENNYKCRAYNISNDEWVPSEIYVPSFWDKVN